MKMDKEDFKIDMKKIFEKDIMCPHHEDQEKVYHYKLDEDNGIWLCAHCNMTLAGEIMKQLAIGHFMPQIKGELK